MSALFKWCMDLGGYDDISSAPSLQGPHSPSLRSRTPPFLGFNCTFSSPGDKRHLWCSSSSDMRLWAEQWLWPIELQQNKERNKGACVLNSKCTSKPPSLPCRTDTGTGKRGDGEKWRREERVEKDRLRWKEQKKLSRPWRTDRQNGIETWRCNHL